MSTYRERRERRAERLDEWADKRDQRSESAYQRYRGISDMIPLGQPILVGHHSERRHRRDIERMDNAMRDSVESERMASSMRSRADNIRDQLDDSIYSDDPDAIEQLEARIAELEAKREKIKEHNKAMRKKGACDHPPECDCRTAYPRECRNCDNHPLPGYVLSNLSGNIKRNRDRLAQLKREAKAREAVVETEWAAEGGVTVRLTEARCEVEFPAKPSEEVRSGLKSHGFRWDRIDAVWYVPVGYSPGVEYARATFPEKEAA